MTTALAKTQSTALAAAGAYTADQVDLIKRTICKGATNDELALFMATAKRLGLDPFARQIFAVKRKNRSTGIDEMAIQVSIDGFRLAAERTGGYAPGRLTDFEYNAKDELIRAIAYVKKFSHGAWHEVAEEATWGEFSQKSPLWDRMPRVMLAKCAEARALRRAFPNELAGVYAPEEMDQAGDQGRAAVDLTEFRVPAAAPATTPAAAAAVVEAEVVTEPAGPSMADLIAEAGSLADLESLVPKLAKVPAAQRDALRAAYAAKKKALAARKEQEAIDMIADEFKLSEVES